MWFRCFLFCAQIKKPNKICPNAILLMDDILHHLECKKKTVNNKINYQPQLVNAGFLVAINNRRTSGVCPTPISSDKNRPHLPLPGRGLNLGKGQLGTLLSTKHIPSWSPALFCVDRGFLLPKVGYVSSPEGSGEQREVEVVMQMMMAKKMILFWNLCDGWDYVGLCHWFGVGWG